MLSLSNFGKGRSSPSIVPFVSGAPGHSIRSTVVVLVHGGGNHDALVEVQFDVQVRLPEQSGRAKRLLDVRLATVRYGCVRLWQLMSIGCADRSLNANVGRES
jgi:hypothetical protein